MFSLNKTSGADCYSINILNMHLRIQVILMAKIHLCLLFEKSNYFKPTRKFIAWCSFLVREKDAEDWRRQTEWPWHHLQHVPWTLWLYQIGSACSSGLVHRWRRCTMVRLKVCWNPTVVKQWGVEGAWFGMLVTRARMRVWREWRAQSEAKREGRTGLRGSWGHGGSLALRGLWTSAGHPRQ